MITLYKPNETDFTHNGIGVLDKHIYHATVTEELNGLFAFTFSYPLFAPHGIEIDGMSIMKVPTPDGEQLFRVVTPKVSMGEMTAQCYHIFYDLTENLIEDIFAESTNGNGAMNRMSTGCQYKHPFTFYSDIPTISSARMVRKNPVEALLDSSQDNSFVNRWGGELKRDNFDVKMLQNRGMDRGVVIRHKKDLLGYEGNVDWKSPVTRIMPQGFDGLFLPEKYVDSPNMNKYPHPKIRVVEFKDIKAAVGEHANKEDAVPLEEAYKRLRQAAKDMFTIQKIDQPKATYKVEFQELSQTEEYKDYKHLQSVYMADTVTVIHEENGVDIKAKVIAYKYDPIKKEYLDITIGNFKESFTDVSRKVDLVQEEVSNMPSSILDAAKANATSLINSGFGGHVRFYPDRILIMDTKDEKSAKKVWQWNLNGLGYSSTGVNGPYGTAITNDGRIVADFITAGILSGNLVQGGEITGSTLKTSNSANFVNISKQF
ncbi:phage tail spike protein, partial [Bacillus thuringiensis]